MGEPDGVIVRPSAARLRRTLLLAVPALALAVLPALADESELRFLSVVLVLTLVPVIAGVVLHFRNKRLALRGGNLVYVDWRGREQVVPGPDIASVGFVTVANPGGGTPDERLVVERHSDAPPLLVGVSAWDQYEIRRLLAALGVAVEPVQLTVTRGQLRANLPGYRPPLHERHPYLIAMVIVVVVIAAVIAVATITG